MSVATARLAPAKVNLYLHVGAPSADGYHPISSLVVFADVGDRVSLEVAPHFAFEVIGPFAPALAGEGDNLVVRAVRRLAEALGADLPPVRLVLDKQLPVAAGLGGGSSDAAAALRLVRDQVFPHADDALLRSILEGVGADGPMCLSASPAVALGRGERLTPAPSLPTLHAVLINPGAPSPTGAVYAAYDRAGRFGGEASGSLRPGYADPSDLARDLAACRNDLQAPAAAATPAIGEALAWLEARTSVLLARMSGSGATVAALCPDGATAARVAAAAAVANPGWWVRACRLGGPWD